MRWRFLLMVVLLALAAPGWAKGPADRIIVTGPSIDGEIVLTSPETIFLLSFALLEDFSAGPVDEPADPGDLFYELERQFRAGKESFRTFDRSRFYPESGYVFYVGIEDGWSEYDSRWFRARHEASEVLATWFNPSAQPALVLMQGNNIHFLDPATLAERTRFEMSAPVDSLRGFVDGPDATTFDMTGVQANGVITDYRVDLVSQEACRILVKRLPAARRAGLPWMVEEIVSRQNRLFAGADFASVNAFSEGRALLYQPDTSPADDSLPGGILAVSLERGNASEHWLPERRFSQVIAGGEQLYALESSVDGTLLLQLRASDGRVLKIRPLPGDAWSLGYGLFDLSAVDQPANRLRTCPD